MPDTLRNAPGQAAPAPRDNRSSPGARSTWNKLWIRGRRRSKSPSRTRFSVKCDSASARFTAVKVLPSAGEGLLINDGMQRLQGLQVIQARA